MGPGHLVVLSGSNGRAPAETDLHDPRGLSDFEAGLIFLHSLQRNLPGITWRELVSLSRRKSGFMGKCAWYSPWDCVQNLASDAIDVIEDTANWVKDSGGDLIRLATDEEVLAAIQRAVAAYSTGGGSEALRAALSSFQNLSPEDQQKVQNVTGLSREEILAITGAGKSAKAEWWRNPWIWVAGGTAVVVGGAILLSRRGAGA